MTSIRQTRVGEDPLGTRRDQNYPKLWCTLGCALLSAVQHAYVDAHDQNIRLPRRGTWLTNTYCKRNENSHRIRSQTRLLHYCGNGNGVACSPVHHSSSGPTRTATRTGETDGEKNEGGPLMPPIVRNRPFCARWVCGFGIRSLEHICSRLFLNSLGIFRVELSVILFKICSDQNGILSRSLKPAPNARQLWSTHASMSY